jgi:hypothetical protein
MRRLSRTRFAGPSPRPAVLPGRLLKPLNALRQGFAGRIELWAGCT